MLNNTNWSEPRRADLNCRIWLLPLLQLWAGASRWRKSQETLAERRKMSSHSHFNIQQWVPIAVFSWRAGSHVSPNGSNPPSGLLLPRLFLVVSYTVEPVPFSLTGPGLQETNILSREKQANLSKAFLFVDLLYSTGRKPRPHRPFLFWDPVSPSFSGCLELIL